MFFQKCGKCHNTFSWLQIYKSLFLNIVFAPITCKNCGREYQIRSSSRKLIWAIIIIPVVLVIQILNLYTTFSTWQTLIIVLGSIITLTLIAPFLARYDPN